MSLDFVSASAILKDVYGPRFEAKGPSYAAVCAWLELAGPNRTMSRRVEMPSADWCRRFGVEVEEYDAIHASFYGSHPMLAGFSKRTGEPVEGPGWLKPEPLRSMDLERWWRPKSRSLDDTSRYPREPFTPEEAEHRRRDAMGLEHEDCPLCVAEILEDYA